MQGLNPQTTGIVASKTFTTIETMTNAEAARKWMAAQVQNPAAQCCRLDRADKTAAFGIDAPASSGSRLGRRALFCGGRWPLDRKPSGRRVAQFLAGARMMRISARQFRPEPALLALVGIWHNQICGYASRAVLP